MQEINIQSSDIYTLYPVTKLIRNVFSRPVQVNKNVLALQHVVKEDLGRCQVLY